MDHIQQPEWRINRFREVVNFCNLFYLRYVGNRFTWERCRNSRDRVRERLDCALANKNWKVNFPNEKNHHIKLVLRITRGFFLNLGLKVIFYVAKPFRFKNSLIKELDIKQAVQMAWEKGWGLPIDGIIKRYRENLYVRGETKGNNLS
ncbi:hypothetical protein MTR67_038205 [Solanum verrucosum]|uniref:Uncharacterized protein n=1 Tax=Solanum verrucosum TaxID=315347 RepID=A0AAF0UFH2_SOLVR|nr:hypothetical protein MTR67_038205 [Solanum verrucosum]